MYLKASPSFLFPSFSPFFLSFFPPSPASLLLLFFEPESDLGLCLESGISFQSTKDPLHTHLLKSFKTIVLHTDLVVYLMVSL